MNDFFLFINEYRHLIMPPILLFALIGLVRLIMDIFSTSEREQ